MAEPAWAELQKHVTAKPIGPICNLECDYCFYLAKESLYSADERWRMPDEVLEAYIRQYIEAQPPAAKEIDFAFQGGEPTLMGLGFFERALELQAKYVRPGLQIHNSLQTNGVLLDDAWCEFLRANNFLVGLSIDGPQSLHDTHRHDKQGQPTWHRVRDALARLQRHGVELNAMVSVHRHNADYPAEVYQFLRQHDIEFIQFIPIVQRRDDMLWADGESQPSPEQLVSPASVLPPQFGRFLVGVFDQWVRHDVGRVFVRDFDEALAAWCGVGASLCVYAPRCGQALALEHNGDLYACDHYVDPAHKLGSILDRPIVELANSAPQEQFGGDKAAALSDGCLPCQWLFACHGACPKDRFLSTSGPRPRNFLCESYRAFFSHAEPYMKAMAAELKAGRPAAAVMRQLRAGQVPQRAQSVEAGQSVGRNDPCPCGSGRKFKRCCMRTGGRRK